jgi:hypothetical protein
LVDAVGLEDVVEGYYAFEFVDVGAAYYGEDVEVIGSEALEGQVEALVGVDVGEGEWVEQGGQRIFGGFRGLGEGLLEAGERHDTEDAVLVGD